MGYPVIWIAQPLFSKSAYVKTHTHTHVSVCICIITLNDSTKLIQAASSLLPVVALRLLRPSFNCILQKRSPHSHLVTGVLNGIFAVRGLFAQIWFTLKRCKPALAIMGNVMCLSAIVIFTLSHCSIMRKSQNIVSRLKWSTDHFLKLFSMHFLAFETGCFQCFNMGLIE